MDRKEAVLRIKNHMEHHGIGKYPHLKLKEALDMAIAALSPPNEPLTQEDIDKMHFDCVWIDYGLDDSGERCGEDGVILYGKCRKFSDDTVISYCVMGPCPEEKLSNADRIRAMSDEELAEFLILSPEMEFDVCRFCEYGNTSGDDRGICLTKDGICRAEANCAAFKKWLRQPAKEDEHEAD